MIVGNLLVRLVGDSTAYTSTLARSTTATRQFAARVRDNSAKIATGMAGIAAAAGVAGAAILKLASNAADYADLIDKTAVRTGIARSALQEMRFVGDQLGVSFGSFEAAIKGFTRQIPTIRTGTSESSKEFAKLGVSLTDSQGQLRSMSELFPDVLRGLAAMANTTERDAAALTLLGRGGQAMIPILEAGEDTIKKLTDRAHELGIVLEDEAVAKLVAYKDRMDELNKKLEVDTARAISDNIEQIQALAEAWNAAKTGIISFAAGAVEGAQIIGKSLNDLVNWARDAGEDFGEMFGDGLRHSKTDEEIKAWAERLKKATEEALALAKVGGEGKFTSLALSSHASTGTPSLTPPPPPTPAEVVPPLNSGRRFGVTVGFQPQFTRFQSDVGVLGGLGSRGGPVGAGANARTGFQEGFGEGVDTTGFDTSGMVAGLRAMRDLFNADTGGGSMREEIAAVNEQLLRMKGLVNDELVLGMQDFVAITAHGFADIITGAKSLSAALADVGRQLRSLISSVIGTLLTVAANYGISTILPAGAFKNAFDAAAGFGGAGAGSTAAQIATGAVQGASQGVASGVVGKGGVNVSVTGKLGMDAIYFGLDRWAASNNLPPPGTRR